MFSRSYIKYLTFCSLLSYSLLVSYRYPLVCCLGSYKNLLLQTGTAISWLNQTIIFSKNELRPDHCYSSFVHKNCRLLECLYAKPANTAKVNG